MADIKSIWVPGTLLRDNMLIQEAGNDDGSVIDDNDSNADGMNVDLEDIEALEKQEPEHFGGGSGEQTPESLFNKSLSEDTHVTKENVKDDFPADGVSDVGSVDGTDDDDTEEAGDKKQPVDKEAVKEEPVDKEEDKEADKEADKKEPVDKEADKEEDKKEPVDKEADKKKAKVDPKDIKVTEAVMKDAAQSLNLPLPKSQDGGLDEDEYEITPENVLEGAGWFNKNQPQLVPQPEVPHVPVLEQATGNTADLFNILQSMFVSSNDNTLADLMEESAYDIHKIKSYLSEISKSLELIATAAVKMSDKPKGTYQNNNYQGNNNKMNGNN